MVTKKALVAGWRATKLDDPPANPAAPGTTWGEGLAWAASIATAQLAIRERTLSARLVRMIGTFAPSTMPVASCRNSGRPM